MYRKAAVMWMKPRIKSMTWNIKNQKTTNQNNKKNNNNKIIITIIKRVV